jgi:lipid-binding SYLF domain-containing protein
MRKNSLPALLALTFLAVSALPFSAQVKAAEAEKTIEAARSTLADFLSDPDMRWLKDHFREAKGVLIIPERNKGGFIIAGSGGVGVLLAKDAEGRWSEPAFYRLGSVSVGFQIGGERSEVILFIQSQKGVDSFLASSLKLGGEASVAAGPVGQGAQAATADVLSFSRSKGAFVGASLEGTVVTPSGELNRAFYGKPASPVDILVRSSAMNPKADSLKKALTRASEGRR